MNIIIFAIILVAVIVGVILSIYNSKKYNSYNPQLTKLNNSDVSCGKAFKYLKLSNSVRGNKNDRT